MQPLVLPPQYSQRILAVSYIMLISAATAAVYELYWCCLCALSVFTTSQVYWRHPIKGIRRLLDMAVSALSLFYHMFLAWTRVDSRLWRAAYFLAVFCGVSCYLVARQTKSKDASSALHCALHVFGNISNVILYSSLSND